ADRAITHFDDLEAAYIAMQVEQQKADLLAPITERHADLVTARDTIARIDTYGLTRDGDTPVALWALRTEARLLGRAVEVNAEPRRENQEKVRVGKADEDELSRQLDGARAEHREAGGAELENLAAHIEAEKDRREDRLARRDALAGKTMVLAAPLASRA